MLLKKEPLVSILMTAYNREKYIAEAIESVLASTYTNFELIIVDDGSKDRTVEIARSFEKKDNRIKVYVNETNLGDYPNRNKAASYARGKYLKYLDSDDVIYEHSLTVMVEAIEKFPNVAYAFLSATIQDDDSPYPKIYSPEQCYFENFFNGGFFYPGPVGTIILKSAFDAIGGFSGIRMVGDYELWLALGARFNVLKIQPGLIWWRRHEGQEYYTGHKSNIYLKLIYNVTIKALESKECPLSDELRTIAIKKWKNLQSRAIMKLFLKGDFKLGFDIFKFSELKYPDLVVSLVQRRKNLTNKKL